jgi:type IV pilus assembly protein PilW
MYTPDGAARPQRGVSLIELMVGLVVSMLVILAATGNGVVMAALQRQAGGASGAFSAAEGTLAAIKEEVGQAGLGFFLDAAPLCAGLQLSVGSTDLSQSDFTPLRIGRGTAGDQIDVMSAGQVVAGAAVLLAADSDGSQARLQGYLPAAPGQAVLLAPAAAGGRRDCTVRSVVSVVPADATRPQSLGFEASGTHNQVAFTDSRYPARSRALLLDQLQWQRYRLDGSNLLVEQPMSGRSAVAMRDVVAFRVQLGVAAAGGSAIEAWAEPEGDWASLGADKLARVRALRIGVVKRSAQAEKAGADGVCRASDAAPQLFGRTVEAGPGWACYRYRAASVTVALRNLVLGVAP